MKDPLSEVIALLQPRTVFSKRSGKERRANPSACKSLHVRECGLTSTRSATGGARRVSCAAGLRAAATVTRGAC